MCSKKPDLKKAWAESVEPVQSLIRNRFICLKLKEEPFRVKDPVSDQDIDTLQRHLKELFPSLNFKKLQKLHTKKFLPYNTWKEKLCLETTFTFQIKKNVMMKIAAFRSELKSLKNLPEPDLDTGGEHYKHYGDGER